MTISGRPVRGNGGAAVATTHRLALVAGLLAALVAMGAVPGVPDAAAAVGSAGWAPGDPTALTGAASPAVVATGRATTVAGRLHDQSPGTDRGAGVVVRDEVVGCVVELVHLEVAGHTLLPHEHLGPHREGVRRLGRGRGQSYDGHDGRAAACALARLGHASARRISRACSRSGG